MEVVISIVGCVLWRVRFLVRVVREVGNPQTAQGPRQADIAIHGSRIGGLDGQSKKSRTRDSAGAFLRCIVRQPWTVDRGPRPIGWSGKMEVLPWSSSR